MKESEFEMERTHLNTWQDLAGTFCNHDYQFVATLETISNKMGDFIFRELYQCCQCKKIGIMERRKKIGTVW